MARVIKLKFGQMTPEEYLTAQKCCQTYCWQHIKNNIYKCSFTLVEAEIIDNVAYIDSCPILIDANNYCVKEFL